MSWPHLAFVSPPGGSLFMEELLASVADAVRRAGGSADHRRGRIDAVVDAETVAVVVPHEYFAVDPTPSPLAARRTIGFGVEHPGTVTFETAAGLLPRLGGSVEIADDAVVELRRRGIASRRFVLGYSPAWEEEPPAVERDVDVVHLGTADERRLQQLARVAGDLAQVRTELLLAPHEPMTATRPDFVWGEAKADLLRRSRLLLNLHRERATAFEWVRALDAVRHRCVVLTTPSTGLAPFVPGDHVLVAEPDRIGLVAVAALADPGRLTAIADAAYDRCRRRLDMVASAADLLTLATEVAGAAGPWRRPPPAPADRQPPSAADDPAPMAVWVPSVRSLPVGAAPADRSTRRLVHELAATRARIDRQPAVVRRGSSPAAAAALVDVVCVSRAGDGPLALTLAGMTPDGVVEPAVHVARDADDGGHDELDVATTVVHPVPVGRGAARNHLLAFGSAPYVLVLDAGDEVLGPTVADLVARLDDDADLDLVFPMAVLGSRMVVNALVPEARRLARHSYLDRGYLVRRSLLERLGGFAEGPEVENFVDHDLWRRVVAVGGRTELRRRIGFRLWEQQPDLALADVEPAVTLAALAARVRAPSP